jgi:diadenosine tetraphosphate (Ap4A) HIT family hydrolase
MECEDPMTTTPPPASVPSQWELHPQLASDTVAVGDLGLSRLMASRDANYPWLLLVPRRPGATEIIDLNVVDQSELLHEVSQVARALKSVTACDKLNIAAIGNVVAQLHVHIVARRRTDVAWPKPVWGAVPALAYAPGALERFVVAIRNEIGL